MSDANVFMVLGSSGGIGSAVCRQLARSGAKVVAVARNADRLAVLAESTGVEPLVMADAGQPAEVEQAALRVVERFGRLDGIAHCVGSLLLKPAHLTTVDEWNATLATNLSSGFGVVRAAAQSMPHGGSVVLVSSAAARVGLANHEAIAAAKAGLIGLALSAAATYASRGLRFNVVAPGLVRTPLTAKLTANSAAENASIAMHPLGRLGEPDDVARAIAWLLSPEQSWVTAQVIGVDGGLADLRPRGGR